MSNAYPDIPLLFDIDKFPKKVVDYIERGMQNVEGWGIDPFLARLFILINDFQTIYGVSGNIFEIGVHHGRSAILLSLMSNPGEVAVFLDLFERQDENIDASGHGSRAIFEKNLEKWAPKQSVELVQANSLEIELTSISSLQAGVRFVHIDGAHYREAVLNDLAKAQEILTESGVVIVDDFMHSGFPEVNEACNYYLEQDKSLTLSPVALGHNKLILTTNESQETMKSFLLSKLVWPLGREVKFHGHKVICLDAN